MSHNAYISMDGYLDICFRRSVLRAATTTLQHAGCVGNMLTLWLNGPVSDYLMSGRFGVHFWRRWDVGFLFQFRGHQMIHVLILSRTPSLATRWHGPVIKTFCRVLSRVVVSSRRHDDCPDSFDQRASSWFTTWKVPLWAKCHFYFIFLGRV